MTEKDAGSPSISTVLRLLARCCLALLPATAGWAQSDGCSSCHDVDDRAFAQSVHGSLGCTACHDGAASQPHDLSHTKADCSVCHDDVVATLAAGAHAHILLPGERTATLCSSCHGPIHSILSHVDPASPAHPARQPETCGACHAKPEARSEDGLGVVRPVEAYRNSVHARGLKEGRGAACTDCHTAHAVTPSADVSSAVNRRNVVGTCGACHHDVAEKFKSSIHGVAFAHGVREAPVCTDCHGEHRILSPADPDSPTFATNIPLQTCGRCHADIRLGEKYGLPLDKVPAYADSYHGLAARAGVQSVAHCASCHGVHDILPSSDPRSYVHASNLAATCGRCHPGAGTRFAIGRVHVTAVSSAGSVSHYVRAVYLPLIFLVVGAMVAHNLLDLLRKARARVPVRPLEGHAIAERMSLTFRIVHGLVMLSFPILVYTGFALKYPEQWWARPLLQWESSLGLRGWLHRAAAIVLVAALLGHLIHVLVSRSARRSILAMRPAREDWHELVARLRHYFGAGPAPHGIRLGYVEKAEYWAFLWGTLLMALTGAALWFENLVMRWFPSWIPEAATAIHFYEAILATLAILVWHLYWVVFDPQVYPMDTAWLTGRAPLPRARERGEVREEE